MTPAASSMDVKPPTVVETTLREGEQTPGVNFELEDRLKIASYLNEFFNGKYYIIELGAPYANPPYSIDDIKLVRKEVSFSGETMSHCRAKIEDIDLALKCDTEWVAVYAGISEIHLKHKLKKTREQMKDIVAKAISYAVDHGLKVRFTGEDAVNADTAFLKEMGSFVKELGASRYSLPDTRGSARPDCIADMVSAVLREVNILVDVHCHNDLGLALANSIAGWQAGASGVHVTINGIGERAGITSLEQFTLALRVLYNVDLGFKFETIPKLVQILSRCSGIGVKDTDPIVGLNAFTHKAGTHIAGVLSDPRTHEAYPPELIGRRRSFVVGELVGRHAVEFKLANEYGVNDLNQELILKITNEVKKKSHEIGRDLTESEFRLVASKILGKPIYGQNGCDAVVLLKERPGVRREEVWKYLRNIDGVKDIYETFGSYDYIIEVRAEDERQLDIITDKIRRSKLINSTETLVMISKWRWR